jgi:putative ubiquitin-RnfH superfamily antitoxin RatB of RatAB toxin-antitoxin module
MTVPNEISVEVACATPDRQRIYPLSAPVGVTARTAVAFTTVQQDFPQLDIAASQLGIFGKVVADGYLLREGDRVEIYRPLKQDPRDARRSLAARGGTMGGRAMSGKKTGGDSQ